jgi:hypothetical protein
MTHTLAPSVEVRPGARCLQCGLELTGAAGVVHPLEPGVPTPSPGDFSVCIACGHIATFDDRLSLRELTQQELLSLDNDTRIQLIRNAHRAMLRASKKLTTTPAAKET